MVSPSENWGSGSARGVAINWATSGMLIHLACSLSISTTSEYSNAGDTPTMLRPDSDHAAATSDPPVVRKGGGDRRGPAAERFKPAGRQHGLQLSARALEISLLRHEFWRQST